MASEENEQLVKEVVGNVLSESVKDHQEQDAESEQDLSAEASKLNGTGSNVVDGNQSLLLDYSVEKSNDLAAAEISEEVIDGMKGLLLDGSVNDKEEKEEESLNKNDTSVADQNSKVSQESSFQADEHPSAEPLLQSDVTQGSSEVNSSVLNNEVTNDVVSPTGLNPQIETSDEEDKAIIEMAAEGKTPSNLEATIEEKTSEPVSPPADGMNSQHEERQLEQCQQQSAPLSSNVVENAHETAAEDSDIASSTAPAQESSSKGKNGDVAQGKNQGNSEGKVEQPKAKTKVCAIL